MSICPVKYSFIGASGVGKSSLLSQFCAKSFKKAHNTTAGYPLFQEKIFIGDNWVHYDLWDWGWHYPIKTLSQDFFEGANGVIIVFDLTNKSSFDIIDDLKDQFLARYSTAPPPPEFRFILVGNKSDLDYAREVPQEQIDEWISKTAGSVYVETTAADFDSTKKLFNKIAFEVHPHLVQVQAEIEAAALAKLAEGYNSGGSPYGSPLGSPRGSP